MDSGGTQDSGICRLRDKLVTGVTGSHCSHSKGEGGTRNLCPGVISFWGLAWANMVDHYIDQIRFFVYVKTSSKRRNPQLAALVSPALEAKCPLGQGSSQDRKQAHRQTPAEKKFGCKDTLVNWFSGTLKHFLQK